MHLTAVSFGSRGDIEPFVTLGRGLADARARGKTLLRLKIVLDEGGWVLAPGVSAGSPPEPTPDRLQTMVELATECGLL